MQTTLRSLFTVAVCLGLLSAVIAFTTRARTGGGKASNSIPLPAKLEVERITLQGWGFEPKQINRAVGPFFLIVENHSGLEEVELSLIEESGHLRNKLPVTRNALTWKQKIELPPGTYLIQERTHPEWQCRITVSSNDQ